MKSTRNAKSKSVCRLSRAVQAPPPFKSLHREQLEKLFMCTYRVQCSCPGGTVVPDYTTAKGKDVLGKAGRKGLPVTPHTLVRSKRAWRETLPFCGKEGKSSPGLGTRPSHRPSVEKSRPRQSHTAPTPRLCSGTTRARQLRDGIRHTTPDCRNTATGLALQGTSTCKGHLKRN